MRVLIVLLALFLAAAHGPARAQTPAAVDWLEGCWRLEDERGEITEVWRVPPFPVLTGYAVKRQGGALTSWSVMRIEAEDGNLILYAQPEGRGSTIYNWTEMRRMRYPGDVGRVAFANPQPRYPQNIAYERQGDTLTVTLSGPRNREEVFVYQLIACPAEFLR